MTSIYTNKYELTFEILTQLMRRIEMTGPKYAPLMIRRIHAEIESAYQEAEALRKRDNEQHLATGEGDAELAAELREGIARDKERRGSSS